MVRWSSRSLVTLAALAVVTPGAGASAQGQARVAAQPGQTQAGQLQPGQSQPVVPVPGAGPQAASPGKTPQWPLTVQDAKASSPAEAQAAAELGWTEAEIATARDQCKAVLARVKATAIAHPPIREGACGAPYPVEVSAIGGVVLSRTAIMTCDMVETMAEWLQADVQPAARRYLGGRVVRIEVLSSYSCRNAYGRKKSRLSEHGRANALDIKSFGIEPAATVDLLADWGMTERDIKRQIAAAEAAAKAHAVAKAQAEAAAALQAQARAAARGKSGDAPSVADTSDLRFRDRLATQPDGLSVLRGMVRDGLGGEDASDRGATGLSLGQPSRLGGPKAKGASVGPSKPDLDAPQAKAQPGKADPKGRGQAFLRDLHASTCKRFGTVLGPEANEAHRNHFHLDRAERNQRGNYCE